MPRVDLICKLRRCHAWCYADVFIFVKSRCSLLTAGILQQMGFLSLVSVSWGRHQLGCMVTSCIPWFPSISSFKHVVNKETLFGHYGQLRIS